MRTPSPSFSADPHLATDPLPYFTELTAELADLAESLVLTALHISIDAVIANTIEVHRTAEAFQTALEMAEQLKFKSNSIATTGEAQAIEIEEMASFSTPSRQPDWATHVRKAEAKFIDGFDAAKAAEPKVAPFREDNAIAARVLELHDRLGGFLRRP